MMPMSCTFSGLGSSGALATAAGAGVGGVCQRLAAKADCSSGGWIDGSRDLAATSVDVGGDGNGTLSALTGQNAHMAHRTMATAPNAIVRRRNLIKRRIGSFGDRKALYTLPFARFTRLIDDPP